VSGPLLLPTWEQLATAKPQLVDTMRRYLQSSRRLVVGAWTWPPSRRRTLAG
jgi:hypothetical protein